MALAGVLLIGFGHYLPVAMAGAVLMGLGILHAMTLSGVLLVAVFFFSRGSAPLQPAAPPR